MSTIEPDHRRVAPLEMVGECPYEDPEFGPDAACSGFPHDCPEPVRCLIDHLHNSVGARPSVGVVVRTTESGSYEVLRVTESTP